MSSTFTTIVRVSLLGDVHLDTGGWNGTSTFIEMSKRLRRIGMRLQFSRRADVWLVHDIDGRRHVFRTLEETLVIPNRFRFVRRRLVSARSDGGMYCRHDVRFNASEQDAAAPLAPRPPAPTSSSEDDESCVVCMDRSRCMWFDCNHMVTCSECYATMEDMSVDRKVSCPMCRHPIEMALWC